METADPQVTYNLGCDLGRGAQDGTEPSTSVVVLDFGMPVSLGHGTYGTSLFSGPNSTTTTIQHAAEAMARGFWTCTVQTPPDLLDDRAPLTIGVGTSNYGSHVTYGHGRAWGRMVNQANQTLRRQGWSSKVAIVGASDLELSWSSPSVVRAWENGYAAAAGAPLIDFGDAAGCPPASRSCGTSAHPEWTQRDVWKASWGHAPAEPLPEIYLNDGVMAQQWYGVAQRGSDRGGSAEDFVGAMTQHAACRQTGCDPSTDNTPSQGWTQLYDALSQSDTTAQVPPFSTDISWESGSTGTTRSIVPDDGRWPSGIFQDGEFPASEYRFVNRWTGTGGGRHITVYAGSLAADPSAGLVLVVTVSRDLGTVLGTTYPVPDGPVKIVSVQSHTLRIQGTDGFTWSFDVMASSSGAVRN